MSEERIPMELTEVEHDLLDLWRAIHGDLFITVAHLYKTCIDYGFDLQRLDASKHDLTEFQKIFVLGDTINAYVGETLVYNFDGEAVPVGLAVESFDKPDDCFGPDLYRVVRVRKWKEPPETMESLQWKLSLGQPYETLRKKT